MKDIDELRKEVRQLKERNMRVEADKAWDTSLTRRGSIFALTYIMVVLFFFIAEIDRPFFNACVPAGAFVLSTLTMPVIKSWWLKQNR